MIQQQSASRVQLPSLSASKVRKHGCGDSFLVGEQRQMKARAHGESDVSSDQDSDQSGDGNSSDGEGSASSPTDDGSSEEVIAMSLRTKYVHKKKSSRNSSRRTVDQRRSRQAAAQRSLAVPRSSVCNT